MTLVAVLLALLLEHFVDAVRDWRRLDWFDRYSAAVWNVLEGRPFRDGPGGVALVVGGVTLAVWLVWALLDAAGWLLGFPFAVLVLVYTFGPGDLNQDVEAYLDAARRGDAAAARQAAAAILEAEPPADPAQMAVAVHRAIFVQLHRRLLGVLFWFLVLGPVGAALYRAACLARAGGMALGRGYGEAAAWLAQILDWPGTRLEVAAFALAGSFVDTVSRVRSLETWLTREGDALVADAGAGALEPETAGVEEEWEAVAGALALARRAFLVWLAVIALLTIAGWVS